jgi:FkbM family methyltransferase
MAKIFLDCGAWNGYSVKVFRQLYDPNMEYEIYSFEANPYHVEFFPKFEGHHKLVKNAVWVDYVEKDFYLDYSKKRASSTLLKEKTSGILDKDNPIKVTCIDLDDWIKNMFNKHDEIVLKLDIEGAEYTVLPHMIERGSIDYINKLFIEWHWHKVGVPKPQHDVLVEQIKDKNIPIVEKWKVGYKK